MKILKMEDLILQTFLNTEIALSMSYIAYFWQAGQKWVPLPASMILRIGVPHTRQGSPVRR